MQRSPLPILERHHLDVVAGRASGAEENGRAARQEVRPAMCDLVAGKLRQLDCSATRRRNAPECAAVERCDDGVVRAPGAASAERRICKRGRRATGEGDLLQLSACEESEPSAIGRKNGAYTPSVPGNSTVSL